MDVSVLGIGQVSALGCGIGSLKAGLEGKKQPVIETLKIETADGVVELRAYTAGIEGLDRFVPRQSLRRIDRFIQMALLSSYLAVEDSGVELMDKTRVGVVFGSGYGPLQTSFGFFDSLIDFGDKCASPTMFANSVHNSLASQVSISLKINGPCLTVTCFEQTAYAAISTALNWLREGAVDHVLAGMGDEYCAVRGYATVLAGSRNVSAISPFCFDGCTYLPGEGFVTFLLGKAPSGNAYCRLTGIESGKSDADIGRLDAVFLAANGDSDTNRLYEKIAVEDKNILAYSPLYGGMPVGNGFDLAIAALSLKEGIIYPSPDTSGNPRHLSGNEHIGCLGYDRDKNITLFTLTK